MKSPDGIAVRRGARLTLALLTAMCAMSVVAGEAGQLVGAGNAIAHDNAQVGVGVEQRLREELRVVMTDLIETGAFGDRTPQQIALAVDTPAQRVSNLGLLIDSAHDAKDGLHVLGVTPGSSAERMGLHSGDVLVAVNGTPLMGDATAASTLRHTVDVLPDAGRIAFDLRRNGRAETATGSLSGIYLPAMHLTIGEGTALASNAGAPVAMAGASPAPSAATATTQEGCGRISDFDVAPRQQQLHGAKIMLIDGVTPGPSGSKAYRVSAGPHVLEVAERIESRYLSFNDRQRNAGLDRDRYKSLTVDVASNTTTLIAARLNDDKRNVWQGGAYWDAVAWRQLDETCR